MPLAVGIMQPYFFPYIGYFQLMAACDLFIVYDDAQFIKGGWITRNRILVNGGPEWLTVPIAAAPHSWAINQRHYLLTDRLTAKVLDRLHGAYHGAPELDTVMQLVERVMEFHDSNVAVFNTNLLRVLASHLGIRCEIRNSSEHEKNTLLKGQELVIDMCTRAGASLYINPVGGTSLYQAAGFSARDITLSFLQSNAKAYRQYREPFVPALSIIDVMMFNPVERVRDMLSHCAFVPAT
jgi:hypothetical protein